jgi:hypothetical protein
MAEPYYQANARAGFDSKMAAAASGPNSRVIRGTTLCQITMGARVREAVEVSKDDARRRYGEGVDEEIQYGVSRGTELVVDRDRSAGRVVSLGGRFHHEPGVLVEPMESTGHLDQPGPDRTVADANGQLGVKDLGQPRSHLFDEAVRVVLGPMQSGGGDQRNPSLG